MRVGLYLLSFGGASDQGANADKPMVASGSFISDLRPYRRANARLSGFAHGARLIQATEVSVKIFRNVRNVVGIAGMLLGGYIFVRSIPDVARYIRISTM